MSLGILTNVSGLAAQRSLTEANRMMETSMERLTTGQRINNAGDDAAGLATASRMEAQIRSLDMAAKNAIDGQAMVQTIEASLEEVDSILQRMRELSVQAANGTLSVSDRLYIEGEKDALVAEIDRIQANIEFNGVKLFDGNLSSSFQVGTSSGDTIAITQGTLASSALGGQKVDTGPSALVAAGTTVPASVMDAGNDITITNNVTGATAVTTATAADTAKQTAAKVNALTGTTGVIATASNEYVVKTTETTAAMTITVGGGVGTATTGSFAVSSASFGAMVDAINNVSGSTGVTAALMAGGTGMKLIEADGDDITLLRTDTNAKELDIDGLETDGTESAFTEATLQGGGSNDGLRLSGRIVFTGSDSFTVADGGTATDGYLGAASENSSIDAISAIDLTSISTAGTAMGTLDGAIEKVADMRADLGAIDNRLTHTHQNLLVQSETTSAARSKIIDTDYAVESANLAKAQVLMQAGTAMLAQANASPQMVLQLLQ
jgi:flagellin